MPRYIKIILWGCVGLLVILILAVVIAATFNWNHAKPWINRQASELAHRPVAIEGDLSVKWLRSDEQSGWRGWVPWPEITAQQLIVGNPPESALEGNMAEIKNLTVVVNPWALLTHTVDLPAWLLTKPMLLCTATRKALITGLSLTKTSRIRPRQNGSSICSRCSCHGPECMWSMWPASWI